MEGGGGVDEREGGVETKLRNCLLWQALWCMRAMSVFDMRL